MARTFTEPEVQAANESGCIFYDDPATLRDEQIDPLLRDAVRRINHSGWVWTAESCQGHPDDASGHAWANNTRPMLPDGPAGGTSPAKAQFLEGLLSTWLAIAAGRQTPTAEQRRRGRAAAGVALAELHRPV